MGDGWEPPPFSRPPSMEELQLIRELLARTQRGTWTAVSEVEEVFWEETSGANLLRRGPGEIPRDELMDLTQFISG